jgi:hypothetical protein
VTLPGVDLGQRGNQLEQCLERSGLLWRWVGADELDDPTANDLSPTVPEIGPALRRIAGQSGCA